MRFNLVGQTVKVKMVECGTCDAFHREGVPCKNCGAGSGEPTVFQEFVKSVRHQESQGGPVVLHCYDCGHSQAMSKTLAESALKKGCPGCGDGSLLDILSLDEFDEMRMATGRADAMERFQTSLLRSYTGKAIQGSVRK